MRNTCVISTHCHVDCSKARNGERPTLLRVRRRSTGMAAETWSTKITSYFFCRLQMRTDIMVCISVVRQMRGCWPASSALHPLFFHARECKSAGYKAEFGQGWLWKTHLNAMQAIHTATSMQRTYAQNACMRLKTVRGNQPPATVTENWPVSVSLKHLFLS